MRMQKRELQREHEYITLRGKELSCRVLLSTLGNLAYVRNVMMGGASHKMSMLVRPIQIIIDCYYFRNNTYISEDFDDKFFTTGGMSVPVQRHLPEAICEMIDDLEVKLRRLFYLDARVFNEFLDESEKETLKRKEMLSVNARKEKERLALAAEMTSRILKRPFSELNALEKAAALTALHQEKNHSEQYKALMGQELFDSEALLCLLFAEILFESTFSPMLSQHLVESLHRTEIVSETTLITLLHKGGFEHDYEWYSEDFPANPPNEKTCIRIDDLLHECEADWVKYLGVSE